MDSSCEDTYTAILNDPSWTVRYTELLHRSKQNTVRIIQTIQPDMDNIFEKQFFIFYIKHGNVNNPEEIELLKRKVIHDWLEVFEKELLLREQEQKDRTPKEEQESKWLTNIPARSTYELFKTDTVFFINTLTLFSCYFFSKLYYLAVVFFGGSSYQNPSPAWCLTQDFVPDCLPEQPDDLLNLTM